MTKIRSKLSIFNHLYFACYGIDIVVFGIMPAGRESIASTEAPVRAKIDVTVFPCKKRVILDISAVILIGVFVAGQDIAQLRCVEGKVYPSRKIVFHNAKSGTESKHIGTVFRFCFTERKVFIKPCDLVLSEAELPLTLTEKKPFSFI